MPSPDDHFQGKEALQHVVEMRARGVASKAEVHGEEVPGHISGAADTMREVAVAMLLVWGVVQQFEITHRPFLLLVSFGVGWLAWRVGRSLWIGWSRLERLHRLIEQERFEIQHHRAQEREELVAIYGAKGLEGPLLQEVCDLLMVDENRLLKVMLEEELGLTLESYEHPIKQAVGALVGGLGSLCLLLLGVLLWPTYGIYLAAALALGLGGYLSAAFADNRLAPAIVWNIALGVFAFGMAHYVALLLSVGEVHG